MFPADVQVQGLSSKIHFGQKGMISTFPGVPYALALVLEGLPFGVVLAPSKLIKEPVTNAELALSIEIPHAPPNEHVLLIHSTVMIGLEGYHGSLSSTA